MKVSKLIEKLMDMPQDVEVVFTAYGECGDYEEYADSDPWFDSKGNKVFLPTGFNMERYVYETLD